MLDSSTDEFSTPNVVARPDGDGDGVRNVEGARGRAPAPSSRKFGARGGGDDQAKQRLERAMEEMQVEEGGGVRRRRGERSCCAAVRRARTVAEITPTKMRTARRFAKPPAPASERSVATLHATPRPHDEAGPPTTPPRGAAPRPCRRLDAFCRVYQRLMLGAWRKQRERLEESVRMCEKYQNQIGQMEVQVDFLKAMRISECEKRDEALNECQLLRKKNEVFEDENSHLIEEVKTTQEELANVKNNLELAKCDLKRSSEKAAKLQDQLRKKKEEKLDLLSKLSAHEQEIACQTSFIIGLKEKLRITEMNLHNSEVNLNDKQDALEETIRHLRAEITLNNRLEEEVAALKSSEADLEDRSRRLEERLEDLEDESESVRRELLETSLELVEVKRKWYRNAGELAARSLETLGQIARAFLPPHYRER